LLEEMPACVGHLRPGSKFVSCVTGTNVQILTCVDAVWGSL
jgi:hypothetical protein